MANEATADNNFCLFSCHLSDAGLFPFNFARICVKPNVTEEEVHKLSLRSLYRPPPESTIPFIGEAAFNNSTSVASVGSLVFCLGGYAKNTLTNKVTMFNASSPEFKLISICNMIMPRQSPATISSRGILYVFGGLPPDKKKTKKKSTPWAEYLNTTVPKIEQKWMPLDIPLSLVSMISRPFVIPYNQSATVFLIGCRRHLNHGAILFDTTDMSFKEFNTMPLIYSCHPITVVVDRTMYWIDGKYLEAYDFDNHFGYSALTSDSVLSDFGHRFTNKNWGPLLVHLDKNLFCFFTMYCYQDLDDSALHRVVECTKFRATKVIDDMSCKDGHLDLELVGYQSYQCDWLLALHGVLPIMRG